MKKIHFLMLFAFVLLAFEVFGDIIVTYYSPNKICVRIENLNDYPDIAIVGVSNCLAVFSKPKVDILDANTCLNIHKACPLILYAVKKDYLEKKGINKINWNKDKNVRKADQPVEAKPFHLRYPEVETLELFYYILGFDKNNMFISSGKSIHKFANGKEDFIHDGFSRHDFLNTAKKLREIKNLQNSF